MKHIYLILATASGILALLFVNIKLSEIALIFLFTAILFIIKEW